MDSLIYHVDRAMEALRTGSIEAAWLHIWSASYIARLLLIHQEKYAQS